ncbi:MAG: GntR family transcriptional regulator [Brochothrix thermosphacta]|uniref:GntR family transcriptional regulator n=1 Tax=Brochothrix thermosphacta TaxID=2756 RepID=UPI003F92F572
MTNDTLTILAYEEIVKMMRKVYFKEGTQLKEHQLAKEFNMSRTPVRNALQKCVEEGKLEYIKNRGFFIRKKTMDVQDYLKLIEVLTLLVNDSFRNIYFTKQMLMELKKRVAKMEANGCEVEYLLLKSQFFLEIIGFSDNDYIYEVGCVLTQHLEDLATEDIKYLIFTSKPVAIEKIKAMLDALANRETQNAVEEMDALYDYIVLHAFRRTEEL